MEPVDLSKQASFNNDVSRLIIIIVWENGALRNFNNNYCHPMVTHTFFVDLRGDRTGIKLGMWKFNYDDDRHHAVRTGGENK